MDFTGNDTFNLDRSKAPWPKDEAELNALWDGKVKYDELSLKLTGKDEKEIREYKVSQLKFRPKRRRDKGNVNDAELKALEAMDRKEGKSSL